MDNRLTVTELSEVTTIISTKLYFGLFQLTTEIVSRSSRNYNYTQIAHMKDELLANFAGAISGNVTYDIDDIFSLIINYFYKVVMSDVPELESDLADESESVAFRISQDILEILQKAHR